MNTPFLPVADIMASKAHLASLATLQALAEQPDLNPAFKAGLKREINRAHMRAERDYSSGVRFSGMDSDPIAVRSPEAIQAEADAEDARFNSPRGQFLRLVLELESHGCDEAATVREIYCRHLADEREATDHDAIHRATRILADIKHSVAIEAIRVLTHIGAPMTRKAA